MTQPAQSLRLPENDALLAALIFAVDPHNLGGVVLRGRPGPARDEWLDLLRALLPAVPWHKVPVNVGADRLLGGLDFAATLGSGKPVFATGLLEAGDEGVLVLSMAERLADATSAIIGMALDRGEVRAERDGVTRCRPSRFGVVALDEGIDEGEGLADGLADRLAFRIEMAEHEGVELGLRGWDPYEIERARQRLGAVRVDDDIIAQLCQCAAAIGIPSARAELLALRVARAIAALCANDAVTITDAAVAARIVLAHRARRLPEPVAPDESGREEQPRESTGDDNRNAGKPAGIPEDILVDAVRAAIPQGLMEALQQPVSRMPQSSGGRAGPRQASKRRGRPIGVRRSESISGQRLNVLATLKAAAPWQTLRQRTSLRETRALELRKEDLQVTRYKDHVETTTVFVVDASGSQAAQRLAEVKGAIELLLGDCYVRRDQVALVAFRGTQAEVLLPPTRALARVKRSLAALPGGGGTPLAAGIDAARELAESVARQGRVPAIVLLTDGRANISRDEQRGASIAEEHAHDAGRLLAIAGFRSLLVDTSRRPRARARELADAMGARYVPLPHANSAAIMATVQRHVA